MLAREKAKAKAKAKSMRPVPKPQAHAKPKAKTKSAPDPGLAPAAPAPPPPDPGLAPAPPRPGPGVAPGPPVPVPPPPDPPAGAAAHPKRAPRRGDGGGNPQIPVHDSDGTYLGFIVHNVGSSSLDAHCALHAGARGCTINRTRIGSGVLLCSGSFILGDRFSYLSLCFVQHVNFLSPPPTSPSSPPCPFCMAEILNTPGDHIGN